MQGQPRAEINSLALSRPQGALPRPGATFLGLLAGESADLLLSRLLLPPACPLPRALLEGKAIPLAEDTLSTFGQRHSLRLAT
jgi:hypothetical protein